MRVQREATLPKASDFIEVFVRPEVDEERVELVLGQEVAGAQRLVEHLHHHYVIQKRKNRCSGKKTGASKMEFKNRFPGNIPGTGLEFKCQHVIAPRDGSRKMKR